jgi:hypothetical protein
MLKPQHTVIDHAEKRAMFIFSEQDCRVACCDMAINLIDGMGKSPLFGDRETLPGCMSEFAEIVVNFKKMVRSFEDFFGPIFYDHWEFLRSGRVEVGNVQLAPSVPDIDNYKVTYYVMEAETENLIKFNPSF